MHANRATHKWHESLDKGLSTHIIFLDYSKAFDCINHNNFMDKLLLLDVPKVILQWLSAFLSNRTQYVQIDNVISETVYITFTLIYHNVLSWV